MFCKHEWEVIIDETTKSTAEKVANDGMEGHVRLRRVDYEQKRIIILSCKKCGKLDKTIEVI